MDRLDAIRREYDFKGPGWHVMNPGMVDIGVGLVQFVGVSGNDAVLDLCCGSGRLLLAARQATVGPVAGVDISPESLRAAQQYIESSGYRASLLAPGAPAAPLPPSLHGQYVQLMVDDVINLPHSAARLRALSPSGFDHIFLSWGMGYLTPDTLQRALQTWIRTGLLSRGGKVTILSATETLAPGVVSMCYADPANPGAPQRVLAEQTVAPDDCWVQVESELRRAIQNTGITRLHPFASSRADRLSPRYNTQCFHSNVADVRAAVGELLRLANVAISPSHTFGIARDDYLRLGNRLRISFARKIANQLFEQLVASGQVQAPRHPFNLLGRVRAADTPVSAAITYVFE